LLIEAPSDGSEATCKLNKQIKNENLKLALREGGRKRTYSKRGSDQIDLLYSSPRVQWWAPFEKLMKDGCESLERYVFLI